MALVYIVLQGQLDSGSDWEDCLILKSPFCCGSLGVGISCKTPIEGLETCFACLDCRHDKSQ